MYYYMYQITNLVNGKIYVGVHRTEDLDDGYMGSGVFLQKAYKVHGKENFRKEILEFFTSEEAMFQREAEVVSSSFISSDQNYNGKVGGIGGFPPYASSMGGQALIEKYSKDFFRERAFAQKRAGVGIFSKESREKNLEATRRRDNSYSHSHPHPNQRWITDGKSNRRISDNDEIPEGWRRGRVN